MENINPFWHGTPVPPNKLINRQRELRTIVGRILTGQSTAISGAPRSGKTSILHYLMAPPEEDPKISYGESANNLIFSYLDTQAWDNFDRTRFWKTALSPILEDVEAVPSDPLLKPIKDAYEECQKYDFSNHGLEILFKQLKQANKKLVLMIDGVERLLRHPLNTVTFWGGMRHLVSRSQDTLVVIITANTSVNELHKKIQETTGSAGGSRSAFFNFMEEIILAPFAESDLSELLKPASDRFTEVDRSFIEKMAGGHPYLLQVAATLLYEAKEMEKEIKSGRETDSVKRQQQRRVKETFFLKVEGTLNDIWGSWSSSMQGAFISVALTQVKAVRDVFKKPEFDMDKISQRVATEYTAELAYLKSHGFLIPDNRGSGTTGWQVTPSIFLSFVLATRLKPEYRGKLPKEIRDNLFAPDFGC